MTNQTNKIKKMTLAALLSAIGILIPMYAPSIQLEPASFTLASHVPIIIAMFISPSTAMAVAGITTLGFLFGGKLPVIVLRALSHLIFATLGAYYLKKKGNTLLSVKSTSIYAVVISFIHAISEVAIVTAFYWGSGMTSAYYEKGYLIAVIGLVGLGTFIHSLVDFSIALFVWKPLQHVISIPASARIRAK